MNNPTTSSLAITDDVMTSTATTHTATHTPHGWVLSFLPGRELIRDEASLGMRAAEELATGTGPIAARTFAARHLMTVAELERLVSAAPLPAKGGNEEEITPELERLALAASALCLRIERVMARIEPSGPQAQRMFMLLIGAVLTDIEMSEDEDDEPLFVAEALAGFVGQLIRGEWRPVAEALAALESHKAD